MKRLSVLASYGTMGSKVLEMLRPDWDVLLDSGAFTNFNAGKDVVEVGAYAKFLEEHGKKFWRYFNLDRIGEAEGTNRNFAHLCSLGLHPVPVFQRGAPFQDFVNMTESSDLVALGGLATKARTERDKYITYMLGVARRAGVGVHLLGVGTPTLLAQYRPLSADSSDFSSGQRYRRLRLWDVSTRSFFQLTDRIPVAKITRSVAKLLASYRLSVEDVCSDRWWKVGSIRAGILSTMRVAEHLDHIGVKFFISAATLEDKLDITNAWSEHRQGAAAA